MITADVRIRIAARREDVRLDAWACRDRVGARRWHGPRAGTLRGSEGVDVRRLAGNRQRSRHP
ncbi:hypothetical protein Sxan_24270 [Streptomyces xanthophaeus]|uniref:Uncharacterized protein n=1 Tax=Streptomyces xanthophaeus TaxID=67385 RepID=A0A919GUG7_9ACTN|nr:hypothetical protein Sxan_24270 [Streptomyces xanthophaeus]